VTSDIGVKTGRIGLRGIINVYPLRIQRWSTLNVNLWLFFELQQQ
jgi:hypothetical protein